MVLSDKERKAKRKEYNSRPDVVANRKKYNASPKRKAKMKERYAKSDTKVKMNVYRTSPKGIATRKKYRTRSDVVVKTKQYMKKYNARPEIKAERKKYEARPENKEKKRKYQSRPDVKARNKELQKRPEVKARRFKHDQKKNYDVRMEVYLHYSKIHSNTDIPCCRCCDLNSHMDFLSIDHIAGKRQMDSERELKDLGYTSKFTTTQLLSWIKNNDFPEGFQILCANCNFAKGMKKNKNKCPLEGKPHW